jgi:hypothetical protein
VRLALILLLTARWVAALGLGDLLSRVAEEAGALEQNLPNAVSQETLEQRALLPPAHAHFRAGKAAQRAEVPQLVVRQVVSEYTAGRLRGTTSPVLVEYRQVISVDGHLEQSEAKARRALLVGVEALNDRVRRGMLEDFARHGLVDVATDYGLILLEFTKRGQQELELRPAGSDRVGAEEAVVVAWRQKSSARGELEFLGGQTERHPLEGRLWLRAADGVPLRVEAAAEHAEGKHQIRDQATIEYTMTSRGFLAPASVLHRHLIDGQLLTENRYTYSPFRVFAANAAIQSPGPPAL